MANWKPVKPTSLSDANYELYAEYVHMFRQANAVGQRLKEAVTADWNRQYPDGVNGQGCAFNAINGGLLYVMKNKRKAKAKSKNKFDEDYGDDVFTSPSAATEKKLSIEELAKLEAEEDAKIAKERRVVRQEFSSGRTIARK